MDCGRRAPLAATIALAALLLAVAPAQAATIFPWGQCTYWAAHERPDLAPFMAGNAWNWVNSAEAAGIPTGPLPEPGALVVYQPYIHGAAWTGHVAYVERVDGPRFLLSEMNMLGLGVVDQRWDTVAGAARIGVRFVY